MLSDRDSPSKSQAGKKKIARAGAERGDARRARRTPHDEMARRIEPGDNISYSCNLSIFYAYVHQCIE